MRRLLLFYLALPLLLPCSAQVFSDTTYFEDGATIKEVRFGVKTYAEDLYAKPELFMRGLKAGEKVLRLDSIREFSAEGKYLTTKRFEEARARITYGPWSGPTSGKQGSPSDRAKSFGVLSPKTISELEGRIGMLVERPFLFRKTDKEAEALLERRTDKNGAVELRLMKPSDDKTKVGRISARARLAGGYQSYVIRFAGLDGKEIRQSLVARGFHLNESDFRTKEKLTQDNYWDGRQEATLYLRLRSTEKLMSIYQEGVLVGRMPVGRQIDEVNLKVLDPGDYLLEIRDLATNERRYHGIRL
ncbi:MAG: hypothetical protein AAGJ82_05850 [Bacteroidota bacterium]